MPVPGFQQLMLPLLKHLADGAPRGNRDTLQALAVVMSLSVEDLEQRLPTGRQTVFKNRVAWAKSYLKRAGLIEAPSRGVYRITPAGLSVLESAPPTINIAFLERFESFAGFRGGEHSSGEVEPDASDEATPEERLEAAHHQFREGLASEIISLLRACSSRRFEEIVVDVLKKMGYGGHRLDGEVLGRGGDGGVDGVLRQDWLGLEEVYVQAKKWEGSVGRPIVQQFAGALHGRKARKGVLITTSTFTPEAEQYVAGIDTRIILINGAQLAQYMIDTGIGVTESRVYRTYRIDSDAFGEEGSAVAT